MEDASVGPAAVGRLVHAPAPQVIDAPAEEPFCGAVDVGGEAVVVDRDDALAHAVGDRLQVFVGCEQRALVGHAL